MTDEFIRQGLTTSVAQICSNIGWHSMSNSTLQMMTDILYEYFKNISQSVKKFSEISDTIEPDINDVNMAFRDKDVSIPDLVKYLKQVGSIEFPQLLPKFPIPTNSNLNIMKPGSREIVTRPVCVHEHLPTMYPEQSDETTSLNDTNPNQTQQPCTSLRVLNDTPSFQASQGFKSDRQLKDNMIVHRQLREVSSVVMTTSGFLSPSREGKLPESRLMPMTTFKVNNSSLIAQSHPTNNLESKGESHQQQKKSSQKISNSFKKKGKHLIETSKSNMNSKSNINSKSNMNFKSEDSKIKKIDSLKETPKIKALKTGIVPEYLQVPPLKKLPKIKDKSKFNLLNTIFDKPTQTSSTHSKYPKIPSSEKLTTEPDKQKLNIFKKISKVKDDKNNESSGHQKLKPNTSIISKPNSTIVSSDIMIKPNSNPEVIEEKPFKPVFFKPPVEKKQDSIPKTLVKENELELNLNVPKKRKKKQKILPNDIDPPNLDPIDSNIEPKKIKTKQDPDLYSPSMKFSFFGQSVPSILPPALASNPLVPKFTTTNRVMPILEKASPMTSMLYLPGEDEFDKSKFDELSSSLTPEKEKVSTEKTKPKKEHKKIKKEKIKSKKKKDKKEKLKQKEKSERKKEKLLKKLKNKEIADSDESKQKPSILEEKEEPILKEEDPLVPKIKLKLAGSNGSTSSPSIQRKIVIKPIVKNKLPPDSADESHNVSKEKLPTERVKSSAPKSKSHLKDKSSTVAEPPLSLTLTSSKEEEITSVTESKPSKSKKSSIVSSTNVVKIDIPSTTSTNPSLSSSSTISMPPNNKHKINNTKKPKKTTQQHPAFYFDEAGNQVWICPTCGKQDDGSPMVGCDGCDAWYHWVCVGIQFPPECAVWYCPTCMSKRAERGVTGAPIEKAKRGRPLKKKSVS